MRQSRCAGWFVQALDDADALVTSGGVSVGTHDLVKPLLESLGEVHIGRVKLKPGKPFTFATPPLSPSGRRSVRPSCPRLVRRGLSWHLGSQDSQSRPRHVRGLRSPALRKMQGFGHLHRPTLPVRLAYDARASADRTEYQRVTLRREGSELVAETTGSQSSSRLMSLVGAHALVRIPAGGQVLSAGSTWRR